MMILIIKIAITIDINTNIYITNMIVIKMTKNTEDIAMEDLAIAKSSVAISSAHRDDHDDGDDDNIRRSWATVANSIDFRPFLAESSAHIVGPIKFT